MKRMLLPGLLLAAVSCDIMETIQTTPSYFSVTPSRDVVQDALGTKPVEFEVRCDLSWTVELTDPSWGKIEGIQEKDHHNGVFRFSTGSNPGFDARSNFIKVTAGDKELSIPVTQQGSSSIVPVQRLDFTPHSVQSRLAIQAPAAWSASVEAPDGWFTLEPRSGEAGNVQLTLTARDANEDKGGRNGHIRFSFGDSYTVEMDILQNQTNVIRLTPASSVQLSFQEQELVVDTESNVPYQVEVSGGTWVKHLGTKALDVAHEAFSVEGNPSPDQRTATLRFYSEGEQAVDVRIELVQMGQDPILQLTNYGVYGLEGYDFCLGDTYTQLSRLYHADGTPSMRLLDPSLVQVVSIEGYGPDPVAGTEVNLKVKASKKGYPWLIRTVGSLIIFTDEKTLWAKAADDPDCYFIIKR